MNTKTLMTIKMDKSLKQAAQDTASEIGIPLGTLVNSFLKQLVRTKEVILSAEYTPTPGLLASIAQGEKELSMGKLKSMSFNELIRDLKS
jgi:antitoxin component of RelBE/YafQ-DinJ toxin-antitoxin module